VRTRRVGVALGAVVVLTAGGLTPAAGGNGPDQARLVAAGERWWTTSADSTNPVACATCHHDPAQTRGWAASFPKFTSQPPPHARVMTLLQANAEAVRRHYRLVDPRPVAAAITAYLTTHGAGVPLSPGVVAGQPVFPARLRALAESVARGRRRYARRCAPCHATATIVASVAAFPRRRGPGIESLEDFLDQHAAPRWRLGWDSPAMADVISYLVAEQARGLPKEEP
jgi:cytochrome c553